MFEMLMKVQAMVAALKNSEGITLKDGEEVRYNSGYQVADEGVEVYTISDAAQAVVARNGNAGVWFEDGIFYVDHSIKIENKNEAVAFGKANNQISIYGWEKSELIYL